jgi:sulfite exporter TauE/SafE/plastocyanin domain-containing protein/copper chaperone CopZ
MLAARTDFTRGDSGVQANLKSASFRIGGMTCVNCRDRIERELKGAVGVVDAAVNFDTGSAAVTYNASVITFNEITALVGNLDYRVLDDSGPRSPRSVLNVIGKLAVIFALYALARGLGIGVLASAFPLARAGMGYGMLFVIGLVTSVHCAAMCGGINLSQCVSAPAAPPASTAVPAGGLSPGRRKALSPPIRYNAGRVISYTAVGVVVGALGSVISVSGRFQGIVQIAAGTFMVIMGINMLGLFPALRRFTPRLPAGLRQRLGAIFAAKSGAGGKNPLIVGLLNGLMPCGPLQAMQLYALSTGSPLAGGISMFVFAAGTVPLMFGIGALGSLLSGAAKGPAFSRRVVQAGAALITVMGMMMFGYGFGLSGFNFNFAGDFAGDLAGRALAGLRSSAPESPAGGALSPAEDAPQTEGGAQIVNSTLSGGRYPVITVRRGIPVKWTINAPPGSINGCNNRVIIREYRIEHRFSPGENLIEFTPERAGKFTYTCWMGMIRGSITVVEDAAGDGDAASPVFPAARDTAPSPAGVTIPTDSLALAEARDDGYQTAAIRLLDDGIDPAIVVFQRSVPALWIISNDSADPGNSRLVFPYYAARLDMRPGENIVRFTPEEDFDFSTADNVFYGYVKVVDDLDALDTGAIRAEVSEHETLVYPDAYFGPAGAGQ